MSQEILYKPSIIVSNQTSNNTGQNAPYVHHHQRQHRRQNEVIKTDRGRLMVFIDGSNLFYTSQILGIEIDYLKLVDQLVGKDKVIRVYFYAGIDNDNIPSVGWQHFMKCSGFKMVTKQLQSFADGNKKANCDVEMAVDMVNLADSFDTAIVVTGDGDMTYAIQTLVNKGKQVEVVGSKCNTNDGLIFAADRFVNLDNLKNLITKAVRDQPPPPNNNFSSSNLNHHYNNNNHHHKNESRPYHSDSRFSALLDESEE